MPVLWWSACMLRQCLAYGKICVGCGKIGHFKKVCHSRRERAVNETEVETSQDSKGEIETVKYWFSSFDQKLVIINGGVRSTCTCPNKIVIPYKIDTGSKGNIMLWHIFKKLFKNITEDELKKIIKGHIKLRTYNKTIIMQLGTCVVAINFKNIKKRCVFFCSSQKWPSTAGDARHSGT